MSEKSKIIERALEAWQTGKLVAIPTETVYGLAAPVNREALVKRIFAVKERPFFDPLIVHISSIEMAKRYAADWSESHQKLADTFWPGPLTIVVEKTQAISQLITSGLTTVGLRMPRTQITLDLIAKLDAGVAAPSANKFTKTSPTCASHVRDQFSEEDVYIISDDPSEVGIESTIISLNGHNIKILRPGIITAHELLLCLGRSFSFEYGKTAFESNQSTSQASDDSDDSKVEAPGQFKAHYRPEYPLTYLISDEELTHLQRDFPECEFKELSLDPYITARELYSSMRTPLQQGAVKKCFLIPQKIHNLPENEKEIWQGILNRLSKACTFNLK